MNWKSTLFTLLLLLWGGIMYAQLNPGACIDDAILSTSDGQKALYFCKGDGKLDVVRFRVTPFAQPFAYLVTDERNTILYVYRNNNIDFEGLPAGNYRVWAFAYLGNILAKPGQNAATAVLADYCYALTQNFIPIGNLVPEAGTIATEGGLSSQFTCGGDGNSDEITFTTTSSDPFYQYVITDQSNRILAFADEDSFDFETVNQENVRVWGVSYLGDILAEIGDVLTTIEFSSSCFDLSSNFVQITRTKPAGGTVSLSSGETSKTLCAEDLENDMLTFVARNNAATPYAFIVTDDAGTVLEVLPGNTATLSISSPGICRVYGVSYTGALMIDVGDNINGTLSDDCFDLSTNFVRLIKREVDGSLVRLADGGTSRVVCVKEGNSQAVTFANNSQASNSNYAYLITNENNIIVAVASSDSFNFAGVSVRGLRVWGLSYAGTLLARVGDNVATAALSSECYDLSDNFLTITRQSVDGAAVSLASGGTTGIVCLGDGRPDILEFQNTSTSVESYNYVITDVNGTVLGFINGHQFDFNTLSVDSVRVYGLSYSGSLDIQVGENINDNALSSNCFDLSDNFVTIISSLVDGGTVSTAAGSDSAQVCLGSVESSTITFVNTSTASVSYGYIVTNTNNTILDFYGSEGIINFSIYDGGEFRVWGYSYTGATGTDGGNVLTSALSTGCYELSSNYVTITTDAVDGGRITLSDGATAAFSCLNDTTTQAFEFVNTSRSDNDTYYYVVTNDNGVVVAIDTLSSIDLSQLSAGAYRVYGLSITGNLQLTVGGSILSDTLSSECFDRSENFVTITQSDVDGGSVRLENDSTEVSICTNSDSTAFRFENTSATSENYAYILTDTNNLITLVLPASSFNFAGTSDAEIRVWGVSYSGTLNANVGDDITTASLSNGCYELSANFITVVRERVEGATVSLADGSTSTVACLGVAEIGELSFMNTSDAVATYAYLVTDTLGNIRAVVTDSSYDFNNQPIGTYRVYGLSYTGNLSAQAGDNIGEFLSDACFDLSFNFITVTQKGVDGGSVALTNGDTTTFVCGSTSTPGTLSFIFDTDANADYTFLVTDRNNRIIVVLNGNSISFNGAAIGEYRVWGLSYTGTLLAKVGQFVDTLTFSTECFDLSDNFVRITRDATDGGNIAEAGNRSAYTFCPGNGRADVLNFLTTGNSSGSYTYILTDNTNRFISRLTGNSINFDTLPEGSYRVHGLAFTGTLNLVPGSNVTQAVLSNACYDLSNNFISVVNQIPNGGTVALEEGLTQTFTCPADSDPDMIRFFRQGNVGTGFVFLVTDTNNIVEAIVSQDSFDFERPTEGISRVWGVAYSGNLTVKVGDDVDVVALSDDCFDLSSNFISVVREIPNGGTVTLENGDSTVFVCANASTSQVVRFDSTGTSRGEYIYVITDANNVIRNGIAGDQFDFSFLSPPGVYRVWGLAYTGTLIATIGDTVTQVPISDDCYTLSENFVTVTISSPDGGEITANGGAGSVLVCGIDGASDTVQLSNNSQALSANYLYLIADNNNQILQILNANTFDFEGIAEDTVRVWGLSYAGTLLVEVGDSVSTANLASGCFELSSNSVTIIRAQVDGATVGSDRNANIIYTCYNDGVADTITFSNTSTAGAQYRYVLTNENNIIRGVVNGNQFNFETAGRGVSRVWGVSFTGTFTGAFGANITTATLSNGCFQLSDNFITVARDTVLGGDITADNQTDLIFCPSPGKPGVVMSSTSEKLTGYQYIVTDTLNDVLALPQGDTIRFDSLPVGNYRIWGLSYAGALLVKPGDNILGVDLASSCYEISADFVSVYRSTMIEGGRIFNLAGGDTLTVCQSDTLSDVVVLDNNSDAKDADYRYILTDGNNRIILRDIENEVIDFNRAARGTYRIWGVSFTGEFLALANDNAATAILADSCYQLSSNFILVNVETPNPGRVLTADSLSSIELVVEDDSADVVSFIALGAAGGTVDYLVLDSAEVIVAIINNDSLDFESFDPGTYRVRSVVYAGNLTAAVGDTATTATLSDGCFALSSSSVRVTLLESSNIVVPGQQQSKRDYLLVSPNPAVNKLRIDFSWNEVPTETCSLSIFNLIGQVMYQERIPATNGENQYVLNLETLPDGLYILQLRNGAEVQNIRFLKQWQ